MCLAYVCVHVRTTSSSFIDCIYDGTKHHRKSSHFLCGVQVFYILMVAKSDNTHTNTRDTTACSSIKKYTHTFTHSQLIRLSNGNGLVQLKRNRMHYTLVIWVYCIHINAWKWNVSTLYTDAEWQWHRPIVFYFRKYGLLLGYAVAVWPSSSHYFCYGCLAFWYSGFSEST